MCHWVSIDAFSSSKHLLKWGREELRLACWDCTETFDQSPGSGGRSSFCSLLCCHQMTSSHKDPLKISRFRRFNHINNDMRIIWILCVLIPSWTFSCTCIWEVVLKLHNTTGDSNNILQRWHLQAQALSCSPQRSYTVWWEDKELVILGEEGEVDRPSWAPEDCK